MTNEQNNKPLSSFASELDKRIRFKADAYLDQLLPGVRVIPSEHHHWVCTHWLRDMCHKGDECEYLHTLDKDRMPPCRFYHTPQGCSNPECLYGHYEAAARCPSYALGFCPSGPSCVYNHVHQQPCEHYLAGFCPRGPDCPFGHPKYIQPPKAANVCPFCGSQEHIGRDCLHNPNRKNIKQHVDGMMLGSRRRRTTKVLM
ncbi:hypothetical protein PCE1_001949 [Barthelona sp. PCE]